MTTLKANKHEAFMQTNTLTPLEICTTQYSKKSLASSSSSELERIIYQKKIG